jgi:ribosomal protein S18 acetylase RimI-like enzyme
MHGDSAAGSAGPTARRQEGPERVSRNRHGNAASPRTRGGGETALNVRHIRIVEANLDDPTHGQAVLEMVNAYARDPMGQGQDLPEAVQRDLVAGLRRHPTTMIVLAYDGERPIGVAVCFVGFSTFFARPVVNIHDLSVIPGYRGQGVGRRLLEHVEARARELGCAKLTLEVNAGNVGAQHLYRRFGFSDGTPGGVGAVWFLQKRIG